MSRAECGGGGTKAKPLQTQFIRCTRDGNERLRLSDLIKMPYAGGTGEDQLWPQVLPGGPLARWHKPQHVFSLNLIVQLNSIARTVFGQP